MFSIQPMFNDMQAKQSAQVTCKAISSTLPLFGHPGGGRQSFLFHSASDGILVNCFILSTETILFSNKQLIYITKNITLLSDNP